MVLSPIVDGFRLTKVLMDGGSGLNLIYEETLQKMEIDWNRIERSSTTFRGIILSREARCTGKITLDVVFGTPDNYRSEEVTFHVTPSMRLYLPRVEARLRGIIALKAYVAS